MGPAAFPHSRKELRYVLRLPVSVELPESANPIAAESQNISVHGILLRSGVPIAEGSRVNLAVALKPVAVAGELALTAAGNVLRVRSDAPGQFAVAVSCDRPFRLKRSRAANSSFPGQSFPSA